MQRLTEIWVAKGVYQPAAGQSFSMLPNVKIIGGFVGSETALGGRPAINLITGSPSSSTLLGNGNRIITNDNNGLTTTAVLDGFVLTGGNVNGNGGAIYNNNNSNPLLTNCSFQSNTAAYGGAIYNNNISSPVLTNCSFQSNTALAGGAIQNLNSSPVLTNCRFQSNQAANGGAIVNFAFGDICSPTLTNCSFQSNRATDRVGTGGGLYNLYSTPVLINCSFQSNQAAYGGATYNNPYSSVVLTNCSFQSNRATRSSGGAIYNEINSSAALTNCVLWNNGGVNAIYNDNTSYASASYSLFDDTVTGYDNDLANLTTTTSPFVSTTSVALNASSPAIDAGSSASYTAATSLTVDLVGNPRIVGSSIDMGPVEFQGECVTSFSVLGSGTVTCASSPTLTLNGSQTGVSYQLQRDGVTTGSSLTGTGAALSFGPQSLSGLYTVLATNTASSCTLVMAQSATVVIVVNPLSVALTGSPISENSANTMAVVFRLPQSVPNNTLVNFSVAGTAQYGIDYSTAYSNPYVYGASSSTATQPLSATVNGARGTIVIPANATSVTLLMNAINDGFYEPDETIIISLLAGCDYEIGGASSVTAVILNDDALPTRLYVRASAVGQNNGQNWANAFNDLQTALTYPFSTNVTEIWVANGLYKPTQTTDRTVAFALKNGIAVYGGFVGTETTVDSRTLTTPLSTTLSGEIGNPLSTTDNSDHVLNNAGLNASALLDGFLITGGYANFYGGGMYNENSSPTLRNCIFQNNGSANYGAGMANFTNSSPRLVNCSFLNNAAIELGGAVFDQANSSPQFINCSFQGNSAGTYGGAFLNLVGCQPVLTNCVLFNNGGSNTFYNILFGDNTSGVTATYCLLEPTVITATYLNISGPGNLTNATTSPFASTAGTPLAPTSPAINAGNPTTTTATLGTSIDLAGNPRIFGVQIDMGAYEYQSITCGGILTTVKAGSWSDPTVWSCGAVPTNADIVQLNHVVTVAPGYLAQTKALRYGVGGKLTYQTGARLRVGL
jgi:hypothetical protein